MTPPREVPRPSTALLAAEQPVAITTDLGRNPEAVAVLDALAHAVGMRVVEASPTYPNIRGPRRVLPGSRPRRC